MTAAGWTPAEIREEISRRGTTIYRLSIEHGLRRNSLASSLTAKKRHLRDNQIVAGFLGLTPHDLWPRWYKPGEAPAGRQYERTPAEAFERVLARVAAGERSTAICSEPGLPAESNVQRYRRENPDFDARWTAALGSRPGARVSAERLDRVVLELGAGRSLKWLARHGEISRTTVRRHQLARPEFAIRLSGLVAPRRRLTDAERAARQAARRDRLTPFAAREAFVRALRQDEVYAIVEAAVPRQLPPDMRDDVKSDLVVALLSGEVRPEDAGAAARRLASAWNRMFMHHDRSFDAEREDGGLGGMIADPSSFSLEGTGHRVLIPSW